MSFTICTRLLSHVLDIKWKNPSRALEFSAPSVCSRLDQISRETNAARQGDHTERVRKSKAKMSDYEGRYEGNGEDADNYGGGSSPQPRGSSHGGPEDLSDSKSQVYIHLFLLLMYMYETLRERLGWVTNLMVLG